MPDIFHAITDQTVGGAGILLSRLLENQNQTTGSLVLLPTGSLLCARLSALEIPYKTFPLEKERSFSLQGLRFFRTFFREHRPHLLVSHASLSARIAAKSLGIPTLSVRHCDTSLHSLTLPLYNQLTDATVATSLPLAVRMRRAGVRNVFMIENGVTHMDEADQRAHLEARRKLDLPQNKILIGLSGRLARVKGHETALRALAMLGKERERYLLCFMGSGEEERRLRALSCSLSLERCVRFLGYLTDVRPFYHAIDAHISCSLGSETSSLALAEGLSAALPTFATDTPGNRARVSGGGLFFPVSDAKALAAHLSLLNHSAQTARLREMARRRAASLPTWEHTRKEYAAVFAAFCGELVTNGCIFRKDMV